MGGPLVWIFLLIAAYFLIRWFIIPHIREDSRGGSGFSKNSSLGSRETDIYRLAAKKSGKITVTDVVTELGLEPKKAEELLESMTDGMRVQMEVENDGMIFYTFPEMKK